MDWSSWLHARRRCVQGFTANRCLTFIRLTIIQAILQTRLYALYSLDKRVLAFMLACFTLSMTASAYIMGSVLSKLTGTPLHRIHFSRKMKSRLKVTPITLPTGGIFCLASGIPSNFYMFWIPLLAFECLLCGLAVFKGLQTLRSRRSVFHRGHLLVIILIRDSILYFFA